MKSPLRPLTNSMIAHMIYDVWAAEQSSMPLTDEQRRKRRVLATHRPHTFPPDVPAALRGPKWGTR